MKRPPSRRRAFALLTVLWCVGLMMVAVLGLAGFVSLQLDENIARGGGDLARDHALSGLAYGSHPQIARDDPLLTTPDYEVAIDGENGRLNLNVLLERHRTDILDRLWTGWGLKPDEAQALDDCLMDWITPGDVKRLNGAKQAEYAKVGRPDDPPGRPFQSVDEIGQVLGFDRVARLRPDWRDFFTLWSNGRLDLNEAPADLIAAFCDISVQQAADFIVRRDPDGKKGSPDGYHPQNLEAAQTTLGMSAAAFQLLSPMLVLQSTTWRIASTGVAGPHRHTVTVVLRRANSNPVYYLWREN